MKKDQECVDKYFIVSDKGKHYLAQITKDMGHRVGFDIFFHPKLKKFKLRKDEISFCTSDKEGLIADMRILDKLFAERDSELKKHSDIIDEFIKSRELYYTGWGR